MRLITVAIHTYEYALSVKSLLEAEGIAVTLQNVNLEQPEVSSGVRVRIPEEDLPLALRILENQEIFRLTPTNDEDRRHVIVVPTDFSDHSLKAAEIAAAIASANGAQLMFLHSFIGPNISNVVQLSDDLTYEVPQVRGLEELQATEEKIMRERLHAFKARMKTGEIPVVKCSWKVMEGVPEDAIVEYAKMAPPYLVVMGTRAFERKEREMIGSVTAEVLDECRFSVLTIPENHKIGNCDGPRNILFFCNLDQEDILAMDALYRYFPNVRARVTIVHAPARLKLSAGDRGKAALALGEYCRKKFEHFSFETVPVSPKNAIAELEKLQADNHYDMIVVPNRRKNAFSRLFNPTLAHKIVFETDIPMLVIPV